jgi:hypothetical protein
LNKILLSPPEAAASTKMKYRMGLGKIGMHHFRFPVPLQADCCYFHGVAESQFLNNAFSRTDLLGHEK